MRMAVVLPQLFPELYFHNFRQVFRTDFPDVDVEYIFYIDYNKRLRLRSESDSYHSRNLSILRSCQWCRGGTGTVKLYDLLLKRRHKGTDGAALIAAQQADGSLSI